MEQSADDLLRTHANKRLRQAIEHAGKRLRQIFATREPFDQRRDGIRRSIFRYPQRLVNLLDRCRPIRVTLYFVARNILFRNPANAILCDLCLCNRRSPRRLF